MSISNTDQNEAIADVLERVAELLDAQQDGRFRVRAYRKAAAVVRALDRPAADIVRAEGVAGLQRLSGIGPVIARAIAEIVDTGRLRMLERLQGELCPERLFGTVPGIGPRLARRIHEALKIETLEQLELAAHDGRLDAVAGLGPRRVRAVREVLGSLLRRGRFAGERARAGSEAVRPSVADLLTIDGRYRKAVALDMLPKIAPRRFNPRRQAWLPVMHADLGGTHFTAMFSNTALAHELGTTSDWVVIAHHGARGDGQATVVTERSGSLRGLRVVRGREPECLQHYAALRAASQPETAQGAAPVTS